MLWLKLNHVSKEDQISLFCYRFNFFYFYHYVFAVSDCFTPTMYSMHASDLSHIRIVLANNMIMNELWSSQLNKTKNAKFTRTAPQILELKANTKCRRLWVTWATTKISSLLFLKSFLLRRIHRDRYQWFSSTTVSWKIIAGLSPLAIILFALKWRRQMTPSFKPVRIT